MLPSIILKFVGSVLLLKRIDNESVSRRSNDLLELVPQLVGKCNWISTAVRCAVQGCRKKMWTGVFPLSLTDMIGVPGGVIRRFRLCSSSRDK